MKSNITGKTYNHDGVECPYCGYVYRDSWELAGGSEACGERECGNCEKTYLWSRNITVEYTAKEV